MRGVASDTGEALAKHLARTCTDSGFDCSGPDLWRDLGWEFNASRANEAFAIRFAKYKDRRVLLAVPPADLQLYLEPSAQVPQGKPGTLRALCAAIHTSISEDMRFDSLAWMLGGPPEKVLQFATYEALPLRDGI
jgi:hypothetical protein